ncbi:MAG TPA: type II secretion system F family protein [Tepidisphaeraceae bacterium]|jgi:tight adherence protein C
MNDQLLLMASIVGAFALGGYFLSRLFAGNGEGKLRNRLNDTGASGGGGGGLGGTLTQSQSGFNVVQMLQTISQAASKPFMPTTREKQSAMRRDLGYAGIYAPSAIKVIQGVKMILLGIGIGGGYAAGLCLGNWYLGLALGGLIGVFAPKMWLKSRIKSNRRALAYALPDALDLMVVCVEAGLTVDAAMQRVGTELMIAHPSLSKEFNIAHMETRVGLSRMEALKNLGVRTGSAPLQSLASMLIQADRFGTSIASALRIHSDSMRTQRQHAAEEMAAKASVKMSFPLVLFIFPATFIVLAGPTVIGLMHSALFTD